MEVAREVEVRKPRLTYAQFLAQQQKQPTIATLLERYIAEMESVRPCGVSQKYTMRGIARRPIGAIRAAKLTHNDAIAYARARRQEKVLNAKRLVGACTVGQELSCISVVLKYAGAAWPDCVGVTAAAIITAKPFLIKQGLISASIPRDRRLTAEEIATLEALARKRNQHPRTRIDCVKLMRWQIASSRRVSETCRIEWAGWNPDAQTMVVTKVKDPRRRDKVKVAALPDAAQEMLYELAHEINAKGPAAWHDLEPRIFPWKWKSCSQAYIDLKKKAGIKGLRLHDSRGECASRLIEDGYSPTQAILVTLHETTDIFQRNYMRLRPEMFKQMGAPREIAR